MCFCYEIGVFAYFCDECVCVCACARVCVCELCLFAYFEMAVCALSSKRVCAMVTVICVGGFVLNVYDEYIVKKNCVAQMLNSQRNGTLHGLRPIWKITKYVLPKIIYPSK